MLRRTLLIAVALLLSSLSGCKDASGRNGQRSSKAAVGHPGPYDVKPLLRLLRPAERRSLPRRFGLRSLGELPFYDLDLAIDPAGARLAGRCRLAYRNDTGQALTMLPLLLHPNAPRELGVKGADSGSLALSSVRGIKGPKPKLLMRRPTLAELQLSPALAPGHWIEFEVVFVGTLRRLAPDANDVFGQALSSLGMSGVGAGASDYGLLAVGDGIATLASAYPMVAPFRQGSFDVGKPTAFGDLAYNGLVNFRVRTALPAGWKLVSNLVELPRTKSLSSQQAGTATTVYTSVGAATRDLVLVAARDLEHSSQKLGEITVTSHYRRGDAKAGRRVLKTAHGALALFQQRFGPYPYTELDVAQATLVGGAGGVEFPGMVLIAGMFYRKPSKSSNPLAMLSRLMGGLGGALGGLSGQGPGSGGLGAKSGAPFGANHGGLANMDALISQMGDFVVAHEVAHQYFAGLVGADCRDHPAVDEPLAQFAAGAYMAKVHGAAEGRRILDMNAKANYGIYRMLGGADLPAAWPVQRYPSALAYAAVVYGKAPYFYVALRDRLGAAVFNRALRKAVDDHRFKLVTLDQWVEGLARGAGAQGAVVRQLAKRHLYGKHGDQDLGVDDSGDAVLAMLMGKQSLAQIKRGLGLFGMSPRSLFRMLLGKMAGGVGSSGAGKGIDPLDALKQLQKLR